MKKVGKEVEEKVEEKGKGGGTFFAEEGEVGLVGGEGEHDEIGVEAVQAVRLICIKVWDKRQSEWDWRS